MKRELQTVTKIVLKTFADFDIKMKELESFEGFNHYHIHLLPQKPVRMREVRSFADDLSFALGCQGVRVEAPVKGKREIAVRVAKDRDRKREVVSWSDLNDSLSDNLSLREDTTSTPLIVPFGITEENESKFVDIAELPHLLITGQTATGKSNFLHGMLTSLILRHGPDRLRLIMADPKNEDLSLYQGLPHLITEPLVGPERTLSAIKWACREVERRHSLLQAVGADSVADYHRMIDEPERRIEPMPYILLAIDEFTDVVFDYDVEAEKLLYRLAMLSRTVGIHLLLSTNDPDPDILTHRLKTALGSALYFGGDHQNDSEMSPNEAGENEPTWPGVAVFYSSGRDKVTEVQTGYISREEVKENVLRVKRSYGAVDENNVDLITLTDHRLTLFAFSDPEDDLYEEARKVVIEAGKASTSYLQRKLRIGYSRAARLMDLLEERGVIGPSDGTSSRDVLE